MLSARPRWLWGSRVCLCLSLLPLPHLLPLPAHRAPGGARLPARAAAAPSGCCRARPTPAPAAVGSILVTAGPVCVCVCGRGTTGRDRGRGSHRQYAGCKPWPSGGEHPREPHGITSVALLPWKPARLAGKRCCAGFGGFFPLLFSNFTFGWVVNFKHSAGPPASQKPVFFVYYTIAELRLGFYSLHFRIACAPSETNTAKREKNPNPSPYHCKKKKELSLSWAAEHRHRDDADFLGHVPAGVRSTASLPGAAERAEPPLWTKLQAPLARRPSN